MSMSASPFAVSVNRSDKLLTDLIDLVLHDANESTIIFYAKENMAAFPVGKGANNSPRSVQPFTDGFFAVLSCWWL